MIKAVRDEITLEGNSAVLLSELACAELAVYQRVKETCDPEKLRKSMRDDLNLAFKYVDDEKTRKRIDSFPIEIKSDTMAALMSLLKAIFEESSDEDGDD